MPKTATKTRTSPSATNTSVIVARKRATKNAHTPLPIYTSSAVVLAELEKSRTKAAGQLLNNKTRAARATKTRAQALAATLVAASPNLRNLHHLREPRAIEALRILSGFSEGELGLLLGSSAKSPAAVAKLCSKRAGRSERIQVLRELSQVASAELLERQIAATIGAHLAQTEYRMSQSRNQEGELRQALLAAGYREVVGKARIESIDDLEAGEFIAGDIAVGPRAGSPKADMVIHSRAGQLLIVEARTSNTKINATKSFAQAIPAKAQVWNKTMNDARVQVVSVVCGHLAASTINQLQNAGVRVVWDHDLAPLVAALR